MADWVRGLTAAALGAALAGIAAQGVAAATEAPPGCSVPATAVGRVKVAGPDTLKSVLAGAKGGDVIRLSGGDYGPLVLNAVNTSFVTLEPAGPARANFSSVIISGSHWIVRGVAVTGVAAQPQHLWGQWQAHPFLVEMRKGDNFIFEGNTVASRLGAYDWRPELPNVIDPSATSSGVSTANSSCVTIAHNRIFNVYGGIFVSGDQMGDQGRHYLVVDNTIDNFAADGIDNAASDILIKGNLITNAHDLCENKCVHGDGIQGWNYNNKLGIINENVIIDSNTIIQQATAKLALPADALQGITIFDGFWRNVTVINNVVVTDAFHGISISGADGVLIANNTVMPTNPDRKTWILAGGTTHQGGTSNNLVVRNNIAASMIAPPPKLATPVKSITVDHNLIGANPASVVVTFDVRNARYDLHLKPGSPAKGKGVADRAPKYDADGKLRVPPISLGAYQ